MKTPSTSPDGELASRLDHALIAVLSQSRPPQNLRRLITEALRRAAQDGLAHAVELIEDDVERNRASND